MVIPPIEDLIVTGFNLANVALAIILAIIYGKNLKTIRSSFTISLFVFSFALLFENLSNLYWFGSLILANQYGITLFQLSTNIIEFIALAVLVRLSFK